VTNRIDDYGEEEKLIGYLTDRRKSLREEFVIRIYANNITL